MNLRALAPLALLSVLGCSAASDPPADDAGQSADELSLGDRTFRVQPSGDGCKFPFATLFVKRGGKVTFDNGTWYPNDEELTGDDNLSFLVEWPNALGEDGAARFSVTTGTKRTVRVPYLDDELYGDGKTLDFPVYCTSLASGKDVTSMTKPQATVRIYR